MNTERERTKLLPCPFCGESKNLTVQRCEGTVIHPAYRIYCDNCGGSNGYTDTGDHVENWNSRAALQSQDREDALTELLDSLDELLKTQEQNAWTSKHKYSLGERMNAGMRYQKARQAIEANLKRRGEPVCTCKTNALDVVHRTDGPCFHYDPQPAEPRLDTPAQVGHTRFGEGIPWSTVIGAAQRYHAAQNTPTKEKERLQRAAENIKALHQAEPVKVPSDADLALIAETHLSVEIIPGYGPMVSGVVGYARALLAKYGQPTRQRKEDGTMGTE